MSLESAHVCRSVGRDREPCKNGGTDLGALSGVDSGGPTGSALFAHDILGHA